MRKLASPWLGMVSLVAPWFILIYTFVDTYGDTYFTGVCSWQVLLIFLTGSHRGISFVDLDLFFLRVATVWWVADPIQLAFAVVSILNFALFVYSIILSFQRKRKVLSSILPYTIAFLAIYFIVTIFVTLDFLSFYSRIYGRYPNLVLPGPFIGPILGLVWAFMSWKRTKEV